MMDTRWLELREILVTRGWVWHDDVLISPHETMWFKQSGERADTAAFRDKMTTAVHMTEGDTESVDQVALHDDLVSLVAALDAVLDGN